MTQGDDYQKFLAWRAEQAANRRRRPVGQTEGTFLGNRYGPSSGPNDQDYEDFLDWRATRAAVDSVKARPMGEAMKAFLGISLGLLVSACLVMAIYIWAHSVSHAPAAITAERSTSAPAQLPTTSTKVGASDNDLCQTTRQMFSTGLLNVQSPSPETSGQVIVLAAVLASQSQNAADAAFGLQIGHLAYQVLETARTGIAPGGSPQDIVAFNDIDRACGSLGVHIVSSSTR